MVLFWLQSPHLMSVDSYLYAEISKELVNSKQILFLYHLGSDWLDKPHFPFWVIGFIFKILGVSPQSYLCAGFIFYLISIFYTYSLSKKLFNSDIAVLAIIIYMSVLGVTISIINLRAEGFLLGLIIPAIYYWFNYHQQSNINYYHLILGSIFSAAAVASKGLFVLIPIFIGFFTVWIYNKQWFKLISVKMIISYLLILLFLLPELISLYLQFDLHPEKLIFNQHSVSGLKWFFYGSQFGRFFNNGAITKSGGSYLFFVYNFIWLFLPWTIITITAWIHLVKQTITNKCQHSHNLLLINAVFFVTFIIFSLSKFQLDFYIVILFPFASITTAYYLNYLQQKKHIILKVLLKTQLALTIITIALIIILFYYLNNNIVILLIESGLLLLAIFMIMIVTNSDKINDLNKTLLLTLLLAFTLFNIIMVFNNLYLGQYDVGYQLKKTIKEQNLNYKKIILYNLDSSLIDQILIHNPQVDLEQITDTNKIAINYQYHAILITKNNSETINQVKQLCPQAKLLTQLSTINCERLIYIITSNNKVYNNLNLYLI